MALLRFCNLEGLKGQSSSANAVSHPEKPEYALCWILQQGLFGTPVWDSGEDMIFARSRAELHSATAMRAHSSAWGPTAKSLYAAVGTLSVTVLVARSFGNSET